MPFQWLFNFFTDSIAFSCILNNSAAVPILVWSPNTLHGKSAQLQQVIFHYAVGHARVARVRTAAPYNNCGQTVGDYEERDVVASSSSSSSPPPSTLPKNSAILRFNSPICIARKFYRWIHATYRIFIMIYEYTNYSMEIWLICIGCVSNHK